MQILKFSDLDILKSKYYKKIIELEEIVFSKSLNDIYLIDRDITFIIAVKNDLFLGYIAYKQIDNNIDIYNLATNIYSKNKGVMNLLFKTLDSYNIFLEVNENNIAAIKLYEKFNLSVYHKVNNYYGNDACLKMKRDNNA